MNRRNLSERDVCTKFITPALVAAGWDLQSHIREEVSFTKGRVIVRGRLAMSAPVIRTAIESFCATSVGNRGISATDLVTVTIPLPPHAEQRRIVAQADELLAVLDALAAALTTARTTSETLLAAVVATVGTTPRCEAANPLPAAAEDAAAYGVSCRRALQPVAPSR